MSPPLAAASQRLRGRPGRPRTRFERLPTPVVQLAGVTPLPPLLVAVEGTGALLGGLSPDVVLDWIARGV